MLRSFELGDTVKGKKTKHNYSIFNGVRIFINTEKQDTIKGFIYKHKNNSTFQMCISENGLICALQEMVICKMVLLEMRGKRKAL